MKKTSYVYALNPDKETMDQFNNCLNEDFVEKGALMPDAHLGYVAPIGSVLITKKYIVPAWVGFDIGCGVCAIKFTSKEKGLLDRVRKKANEIFNEVKNNVPMGLGETNKNLPITNESESELKEIISRLERKDHDKKILNFMKQISRNHLGTLGSGNHFLSIGTDEKKQEEVWLVIHSGSRGLGHRVAQKYMIKASGSKEKSEYERTFPLDEDSQLGKEYLNIIEFGLDYALLNRMEMAYRAKSAIEKVLREEIKLTLWVNKNHNHVVRERGRFVHRKGATPAKKGEKGVIPANMRDGSYLVEGKGNSKFLNSSSHGAGRSLSRKKAKETLSLDQFKSSVGNLVGEFNKKNIDEAPMVYKPIKEVMDAQKSSVKVIKHIVPIINWQV